MVWGKVFIVVMIAACVTWPRSVVAQGMAVPAFDVATVKPSGDSPGSGVGIEGNHIVTKNMTLRETIKSAYNLNSDRELVNLPKWADTARFDIDAKEDEATAAQMTAMPIEQRIPTLRLMLQALLTERFQLKVHREKQEISIFELIVTKGGVKMKAASSSPEPGWQGLHGGARGELEGRQASTEMIASALARQADIGGKLVVNKTGLAGKYDFTLKWTVESDTETVGPSLFTALQEQLGLKLEPVKAPVDVLVVDAVEMPGAN